ncbi:ABC transporter ATP-binding protein [Nitratireductor aquibiodomus]|uniref:ABC transporter ATP-binding protein n=1 Tax=Nitratireductor aquibiodomus TaxID=204799 RepID=UPI00046A246A|nr:ATP-binding cassette domain-containing protein [Nitratireductor aquibiodomus]
MLNLLARFWDVDEGAVRIGGVDLRDMSEDQRAGMFATVFQDTFLFDDTVAGNLRIAKPEATDSQLEAACRAAACHDFIEALEQCYDTHIGENGQLLSGGQRQRLAIARALLKDAPIVLLDEATASVDPESEFEIRTAIASLCAGRTVIVVAHKLRSITGSDAILVFENGSIVAEGRHEKLLSDCAVYRRLWNAERAAREGAVPAGQGAEYDKTIS